MILFGIPDIRLFWSTDERFTSQFTSPDKIMKFQPFSKHPSCTKDISFWLNNDENEEQEHELNEDIIQVSDDEDDEDDEEEEDGEDIDDNREELIIESETQKWSQLIDEWIEFGNQENRFGDENDESFLSSEWHSDFNFAGRSVHPADDGIAKWSLTTLFESSLESPLFLGSDEIFTNAH